MEAKRLKKSRYITGLDGVRTLAVVGVILYHLMPDKMRGGYLGVPLFFAISGYLITDHLRQEWEQEGRISLKQFYLRRLKRLYPPLVFFFLTTITYITLFQRNLLNNLKGVVISTLGYFNNWWQINQGLSYFERYSNPSPFTHVWYLSVEAQNYLIWPLLFILLMLLVKKRRPIFLIVFVAALASAIWMAVQYVPGADPTRVYYGTDTRIFSIWLGSAAAFIWPSNRLRAKIPQQAKRILNGVGLASLGILILAFFKLDANYTFIYWGGMFLLSIVAVLLIMVVVHPGASLDKWLTNPVFAYIGKRSYEIYLYQYPVMIFYESKVKNISNNLWLHTVIELLLIMICAELSYQLVDKRMKNFDYSKTWQTVKGWFTPPILSKQKPFLLPGLVLVLVSVVGFVIAPTNHVTAEQQRMQEQILKNREIAEASKKKAKEEASKTTDSTATSEETTDSSDKEAAAKSEAQLKQVATNYDLSLEEVKSAEKLQFTAFGDSVMLGAAQGLKDVFPNAVVDADISRQIWNSSDLIESLAKQDLLYDPVLIGLGTNGDFSDAQFDSFIKLFGNRQVYWVNVHAPSLRLQNVVNDHLNEMAQKYGNLTIIDWHTYASNGSADWFYEDGIHVTPKGLIAYVKLISEALNK